MMAMGREQLAGLAINAADFDLAVKKVQPSVRREGFATTPDVTWSDVGSLGEVTHPLRNLLSWKCIQQSFQILLECHSSKTSNNNHLCADS